MTDITVILFFVDLLYFAKGVIKRLFCIIALKIIDKHKNGTNCHFEASTPIKSRMMMLAMWLFFCRICLYCCFEIQSRPLSSTILAKREQEVEVSERKKCVVLKKKLEALVY